MACKFLPWCVCCSDSLWIICHWNWWNLQLTLRRNMAPTCSFGSITIHRGQKLFPQLPPHVLTGPHGSSSRGPLPTKAIHIEIPLAEYSLEIVRKQQPYLPYLCPTFALPLPAITKHGAFVHPSNSILHRCFVSAPSYGYTHVGHLFPGGPFSDCRVSSSTVGLIDTSRPSQMQ